ncbi:hypothetical protein V8C44DRAFT_927 [Trichoderma aethiopicum]
MLPTLGRGSLTRITTFTTFLQRTIFLSAANSILFFLFPSGSSKIPGPVSLSYPLLFVRCPRYPEAVDTSTPLLTRSFGCSRTLFHTLMRLLLVSHWNLDL